MSDRTSPIPELLAPAGGPQALRAAVANGADAVYLGVEVLNARRGAENFTLDSLAEACRFAHVRGVRVYLTVNVVVLPSEMQTALDLVDRAWEAGVDAVIVQDIGLLWALRRSLPLVRVHASTQLNAHNAPTIEALARLGVSRVTLARETSIDEIARLAGAVQGVEVESFVHGALCVCYSGQCLMSSVIGGRSANRGLCAQPCRLPYELVDEAGRALGLQGAHLLSPKDLAGIAVLPELIKAGVAALKIEGRMKSPEYVALVTGVYRAALDRAAIDGDAFVVRDGERSVLAESFSRGFSEAYLVGERGNDMMSYRRPNNRGVPVGRVVAVDGPVATIHLDAPLESADTIEFWTSAGRFAQEAGTLAYEGGRHSAAPSGTRATVSVEGAVAKGDRVFRVRNAALATAARRTFAQPEGAPAELDFRVLLAIGEPLSVTVTDAAGRAGAASGAAVEPARTKPVTAEEVREHVGRLGGTPYQVGRWELELSPGAGIGYSALHSVRRSAIEAYERSLLEAWEGRERTRPELPALPSPALLTDNPRIVVALEDARLVKSVRAAGADEVHVALHSFARPDDFPQRAVPVLPRIAHDREVDRLMRFVRAGEPAVIGNLGLLSRARDAGARAEAHWSLNAVNAYASAALAEQGASFVWLSPELTGRQIAEVVSASPLACGVAVYGRQEIMVTEHCILMSEGECDRRCATCARRSAVRRLRDRKGYEFPLFTDVTGRSHLYNSVPLDIISAMPEVVATGVRAVRLDLLLETPQEAARIVARAREALTAALAGVDSRHAETRARNTTAGHFFRGIQ